MGIVLLKIIRNDITKELADAIVNTVNPKSIYKTVGAAQIGDIARGEVDETAAFALEAKYTFIRIKA